jgi:hypothetical protein
MISRGDRLSAGRQAARNYARLHAYKYFRHACHKYFTVIAKNVNWPLTS